jgi:hypothetical protein
MQLLKGKRTEILAKGREPDNLPQLPRIRIGDGNRTSQAEYQKVSNKAVLPAALTACSCASQSDAL